MANTENIKKKLALYIIACDMFNINMMITVTSFGSVVGSVVGSVLGSVVGEFVPRTNLKTGKPATKLSQQSAQSLSS